jgi:copper homeostasis protein
VRLLLEVCVDTVDGARIAASAGADRIELCAGLALGGLTPSAGQMAAAANLAVPVFAMIRPRDGGFSYSRTEVAVMLDDIDTAKRAGLAGVVLGAVSWDGTLDGAVLKLLLARAAPLPATLHRAFDVTRDPAQALEDAIDLGFARILTSGQAATALEGASLIAELVAQAQGRISIMPGAGVNAGNARALAAITGAVEIHASCSTIAPAEAGEGLGFAPAGGRRITDAATIKELRSALNAVGKGDA